MREYREVYHKLKMEATPVLPEDTLTSLTEEGIKVFPGDVRKGSPKEGDVIMRQIAPPQHMFLMRKDAFEMLHGFVETPDLLYPPIDVDNPLIDA